MELTSAYADLASDGRGVTPYAIKEITSRQGQTLFRHTEVTAPEVVSSSAVRTLTDMMQEVVRTGTGKRAALGDREVAGKTGTSSDYRDAWFMGFTADYTTGVWIGNDDNSPMHKITGGSLPAALWHDYMQDAEAGLPERALFSSDSGESGGSDASVGKSVSDFISGILGNGN